MVQIRLLNKFRKGNSARTFLAYKRQRKVCVELLKKPKKEFYNNLNEKKIADCRKFWQTIKPNFTDQSLKYERVTLIDRDKIVAKEKDVVKKFKDHFEKIVNILRAYRSILFDLSYDPV